MTTTYPALTGAALAKGLRSLADLVEQDRDLVAARYIPEQALHVSILVATADDVRSFAARHGAEIEAHKTRTTASLQVGTGVLPDGRPAYASDVLLTVDHVKAADR